VLWDVHLCPVEDVTITDFEIVRDVLIATLFLTGSGIVQPSNAVGGVARFADKGIVDIDEDMIAVSDILLSKRLIDELLSKGLVRPVDVVEKVAVGLAAFRIGMRNPAFEGCNRPLISSEDERTHKL
jgi:hypothetical protein